jgi:hypothetical protein
VILLGKERRILKPAEGMRKLGRNSQKGSAYLVEIGGRPLLVQPVRTSHSSGMLSIIKRTGRSVTRASAKRAPQKVQSVRREFANSKLTLMPILVSLTGVLAHKVSIHLLE